DHYDVLLGPQSGDGKPPDELAVFPPRNDVVMGAWSDVVWRIHPRVELVPGLRMDVFTQRQTGHGGSVQSLGAGNAVALPAVEPRVTWISTFGVSHQPPAFFVPVPGFQLGLLERGLQTSFQTSQGVELALPLDFTATTTVFLHEYLGLNDVTSTCAESRGDVN